MADVQKQKRSHKVTNEWKPSKLPYKTDYNDHFETPKVAYEDILPLLDYIEKNRSAHVLYDPFYCDGRTARLLKDLGFSQVIHERRDFYNDFEKNTVPQHDTFITNPPYSDDHKEKCLEFALEQLRTKGRSFFILLPNYVASRDYFRRLLVTYPSAGVVYVVPSVSYEYDHPEGTGHTVPPFSSMWFCGIGADHVDGAQQCWEKDAGNDARGRPRLFTSLSELERLKLIPTEKRPNPRQRRKRRKQMIAADEAATSSNRTGETEKKVTPTAYAAKNGKRRSRHRNEKGERKRKRF